MSGKMSDTPKKRGRPSKYVVSELSISEPTYTQGHALKLLELLSNGVLNSGCMAELGLKKDTFYRWIREHDDFKNAYEIGRPRCEYFHARKLQEMTDERDDKGAKACIMILNNNFGWGRDESAKMLTQNTINIQGNMNVLNQTKDELIEAIQKDLQYLESNNVIPKTIEYIPNDGFNDTE